MIFERTKSGLANRPKFYGCDLICFVEGVESNSAINPDSTFWGTIFRVFRSDLRIKCLARGGKPELESLARQIVEQDINENIVAIDSDYDDFVGDKINDRRILYTFGYSWENDVFSKTNIANVICAITHQNPPSPHLIDAINQEFDRFERSSKRLMQADYLALCAKGSIIPRASPGRIVQLGDDHDNPYFCFTECKKIVRSFNLETKAVRTLGPRAVPNDPKKYFVGKVFSFYVWRLSRHLIYKLFRRITLTKDHFRDVGLQVFQSFLLFETNNPIAFHHKAQCARL